MNHALRGWATRRSRALWPSYIDTRSSTAARSSAELEFECVREAEDRTEEAFSVRFSPENIPELSSVKAIVDELV